MVVFLNSGSSGELQWKTELLIYRASAGVKVQQVPYNPHDPPATFKHAEAACSAKSHRGRRSHEDVFAAEAVVEKLNRLIVVTQGHGKLELSVREFP